ncbi:uncharacterized protein [Primulina huaijiensis]|uniref:uncharacterized protein n=1 Tax=Primulina huaijiensis TaxID=1492673 RepID=UPI003CC77339
MASTRSRSGEDNQPTSNMAELVRLITTTVEKILAQRPDNNLPPGEDHEAQRQEIQSLREEMERLREERNAPPPPPLLARGIPFSAEILAAELPQNFRFPNVGEYDGSGDPEEHLSRFENAALLHQYSDPIKCRVFLTTLVRSSQQWFNFLRPGTIKTFQDFGRAFLHQFASSKKHPLTSINLFNVKQQKQESLRDFVKRFNKMVIDVPSATPDILISAFTQGLRGGDFFKSLVKKPPTTFEELLARAEKYMNVEEVQMARKSEPKASVKATRDVRPTNLVPRVGRFEPPTLLGQFAAYTPLKVNKSRALELCDERQLIRRPRSSDRGPRNPRSERYCGFHKDYGHTTDECHHLNQEIERIIQGDPEMKAILASPGGGHRPAKRTREESDPERRRAPNQRENFQNANPNMRKTEPREQPPRGVINMISGGPTDGDSNRARKASSRRLENMEISSLGIRSGPMISFVPEDMKGVADPHNDALVIRAMIANDEVARIFVDSGSSVNVLFKEAMDQMDLGEYTVEPISTALFGFTGHAILPLGVINIPFSLGSGDTRKTRIINFVIVDAPSSYNAIMGRPAMAAFMAIASALHQKIKFPVGEAVGEVKGDQKISRKCYVEEVRVEQKSAKIEHTSRPESRGFDQLHLIEEAGEVTSDDVCEELILNPPSGVVRIARTLEEPLKEQLVRCLEKNKDVFAWCPSELQGVRREVMEHKLNVLNECRPVIQKKRHFGPEKDAIIKEQVQDLLRAGHIQEIYFPTWLSNEVLVPKSAGKWRMCVDFRDLNRACPKDCYPLPRIDQLVDSTAGQELLCFLDAYQGYHQIPLAEKDRSKVSFITSEGTFCYVVMPFGLKNAVATYQRLMDKVFKKQIGKNVEVYVDDILIKSKTVD